MNPLSELPSIDQLLKTERGDSLKSLYGHHLTVQAIQKATADIREAFLVDQIEIPDQTELLLRVEKILSSWTASSLIPVINATGVILHTNLGRAPLSPEAIQEIRRVSSVYSSLEFNLESGERGSRLIHAEKLFQQMMGVEAALVVNNNASAVLLTLSALAAGKKVIISRSQLVEIGGGFRIPDVMKQSGAELIEVGTTNRVHLQDYQQAVDPETAAFMRAHYSNFSMVGFTSEPELADIVRAAGEAGIWTFDDLGSGALLDTSAYGLKHEPTVQESLEAGVDLVSFSGDKLLGGPQAGIILGKKDLLDIIKKHPLARAVRADKTALAALSQTLIHYLKGEAEEKIPIWRMISAEVKALKSRAGFWQEEIGRGQVLDSESTVGGGSLPGETLPTAVLALEVERPQQFSEKLRMASPPLISRIAKDRVILDPRTVLPDQDELVIAILKNQWS